MESFRISCHCPGNIKNSQTTSKCQVFSITVPEKPKSWTELVRRGPASALKGGTLSDFSTFLRQNIKKFEVIKNFSKKVSQCQKTEKDFSTSILSQNIKKIEGGPFSEKNFRKKSHNWNFLTSILSQNSKKTEGWKNVIFQHFCGKTSKNLKSLKVFQKKSHNAKKLKRIFQHPFCRKTSRKLKEDRSVKNISEKSLTIGIF